MSERFTHFLVTRFNLRMKSWIWDDAESKRWMLERIEIFKRFTLPSLAAQTNKNFQWLLLFDPSTKDDHPDFLELLEQYSFCKPVFVDMETSSLLPALKDIIRTHLPEETTHIITTRIDNDDAVHKEFIAEVQNNFEPGKKFVLNFTDGFGYSDDRFSIARRNKVNPFASLFEVIGDSDFKTVYCTGHPSLKSVAPVKHIHGKRMYLVNFHGGNVLNQHKLTTWVGCLWHYFVRYVCIQNPNLNNKIRYSFAIRQRMGTARDMLRDFNINPG